MQAILTKIIPCTDTKETRVKAICERGSMTISYPYELSGYDVHKAAVAALIDKFCREDLKEYGTPTEKNPWNKPRVCGTLPSGDVAHIDAKNA